MKGFIAVAILVAVGLILLGQGAGVLRDEKGLEHAFASPASYFLAALITWPVHLIADLVVTFHGESTFEQRWRALFNVALTLASMYGVFWSIRSLWVGSKSNRDPPRITAIRVIGNNVTLTLHMASFKMLAIDSQRNAEEWEQIAVTRVGEFIDSRLPIDVRAIEHRRYRVQAMENFKRVGSLSAEATAVTEP